MGQGVSSQNIPITKKGDIFHKKLEVFVNSEHGSEADVKPLEMLTRAGPRPSCRYYLQHHCLNLDNLNGHAGKQHSG